MKRLLLSLVIVLSFAQAANALLFVRLTGMQDINYTGWVIGNGAITSSQDVCVYSTLALGSPYAITVTGSGGFNLVSGTNNLAYTITWDDSGPGSLGSHPINLTSGVKVQNLQNANFNLFHDDCSVEGMNARLTFSITQAAMMAAPAGTYTGTLTILLSQT